MYTAFSTEQKQTESYMKMSQTVSLVALGVTQHDVNDARHKRNMPI